MPVRILTKNSTVQDKVPLPTDLEIGELAVNANVNSPAIYAKDNASNIVKLAGAGAIGGTPATETEAGIAFGRDPETGITILKEGQLYIWIREGANSYIELRLDDRFGYNLNVRQGDFEAIDYELGTPENEIRIDQAD